MCCRLNSTVDSKDDVGRLSGLHRPADDAAREEVEHDGQVRAALMCADIGGVGNPGLTRRLQLESPIERVADGQRRLTDKVARPALVADLRPDGGHVREARHPGVYSGMAMVNTTQNKLWPVHMGYSSRAWSRLQSGAYAG